MSDLPVWVQCIGELGIPVVAFGAAVVAWVSYWQRRDADRKAEWWRRVQYALDLMMEHRDIVRVNCGMTLVNALLDDPTATRRDGEMLADVVGTAIDMMAQYEPPGRHSHRPE